MPNGKLRPALKNTVDVRTFRISLKRAEHAHKIDPEERMEQLREIFAEATGLSGCYVVGKIIPCEQHQEAFCITFTTDPTIKMVAENTKRAMDFFQPDQLAHYISQMTSLSVDCITIEEIKKESAKAAA